MNATRQAEAVRRALEACKHPMDYILGAGGRDPNAPSPATVKNGRLGCDCTGLAFHCNQLDRKQPKALFPEYGGWMNTDSLVLHVRACEKTRRDFLAGKPVTVRRPMWKIVPLWEAQPGDIISYDAGDKTGHACVVIEVPPPVVSLTTKKDRRAFLRAMLVVDCANSWRRRITGYAIQERNALLWDRPDAFVFRYVGDE